MCKTGEESAGRRWRRRGLMLGLAAILAGCAFALAGRAAGKGKKKASTPPLDLNSASIGQLTAIKGIGPATAKAIVRFREESGPFERVEDLLAIRGITRRKLEQLRPFIIVKPAKDARPAKSARPGRSAKSEKAPHSQDH